MMNDKVMKEPGERAAEPRCDTPGSKKAVVVSVSECWLLFQDRCVFSQPQLDSQDSVTSLITASQFKQFLFQQSPSLRLLIVPASTDSRKSTKLPVRHPSKQK